MNSTFLIRRATSADASAIARHRVEMFTDMGQLPADLYQPLVEQTVRFLETAIPAEEYAGWVAAPAAEPGRIVGGAGVQRRRAMPRVLGYSGEHAISLGRDGIVLNVFTERPWRKRGIAGLLMKTVLEWAKDTGLDTLVLHASPDGRPLYQRLGFEQTNEMRFNGWLGTPRS